jgi:uncharacterized paraquat-inducible protein A
MTTEPNFDNLAERIRERVSEARDDYGLGQCKACDVVLTQTDIDADECSNCHASLTVDDEDLLEVERGDYGWDGYSHGD